MNKCECECVLVLSFFTVPLAHLLLSEESCLGLWPPGVADGE